MLLEPVKSICRHVGLRRNRVAALRLHAERELLARLGPRTPRGGGRILCYHSVGTPEWGVNDVPPQLFRRQIELALSLGYRFRPAEEIALDGGGPADLAVTFDDGLASVAEHAAPILRGYGIPYTLFVVGDWADGRHEFAPEALLGWKQLERLARDGARIGNHSLSHPDFGRLSPQEAEYQIEESARVIESRLGLRPTGFAIPLGLARNWSPAAQSVAERNGYTVYAQAETHRPAGTVQRTFVTRFDQPRLFCAALEGRFDAWQEWV